MYCPFCIIGFCRYNVKEGIVSLMDPVRSLTTGSHGENYSTKFNILKFVNKINSGNLKISYF